MRYVKHSSLLAAVVAALLLALATVPASAALRGGAPPEKMAALSIPRMAAAPTIDGVIGDEEWRGATAVSGAANCMNDVLMPAPVTFYLGWDEGHLYFACRAYVKKGYKPNIPAGRSPGLAYIWDDALELNWKPMGENVPASHKRNSYKWFLNVLGHIGDTTRLLLGQQFKNWSPQFDIETRLTEPGSAPDGGRWWEMELSSTPADFELEGPHRAGDQWRMMLGINHMPKWMQARIACNGPYLDPHGFNLMTLVDDAPAVQMLMNEIPNLASDGVARATLRAYNPTDRPVALDVHIDVAETIQRTQTLTVEPGASASFELDERLPEDVREGEFALRVERKGVELYRYWTRFKVGAGVQRLSPAEPRDPNKFQFSADFNPVRSWLLVKGDTYYLPDPEAARSLRYRVAPVDGGEPIAQGEITNIAEFYLQDLLKLPELDPGEYEVEATMALSDGEELGPMNATFVKKDEAEAFSRWWGNDYGDYKRVLPPYTGVQREGETVRVVLRDYRLSALGLPRRIVSTGEEVTASPARVVVIVGGEEHVVPLGEPTFTEDADWRVTFEGEAEAAGVAFTAAGWVEQDGLVYVDLTYESAGDEPVEVEAMRIEYPLSETDADALLCVGPGENFSSRTTMLLPDDRSGPLWSTLDTGISGAGMVVGSFYPTVWIGSERRGLLWWADNDEGWVQDDAVPAHEAVRKNDAVVLVNNIVAKPASVGEPRTVSFSYAATPFKPNPDGWRMTRATMNGTFFVPFRAMRKDSKTGERVYQGGGHVNWIHPESRYPEEWDELWEQQRTEGYKHFEGADEHARKWQWRDPYRARNAIEFTHMSFQIMGYGRKSLENETYAYFGDEWEGRTDTWNETYTDYAMSLFKPAFEIGGVRSTYWDLAFPIKRFNLLSGLAYRLPDGRVQPGYNGWNVRRFMMRLHALQYDAGLVPGANGFHSSNAYLTVAMPWCDAVLDGERNWDLDNSPVDWVEAYPPERMRAMSVPHNWGVSICWMANMDSSDRAKRDAAKRIMGQWLWMHDSWRNPYVKQLPTMPDPVLDWGVNEPETEYHPYWRNPYVHSSHDDVLVTLWRTGDRVTLGVFNHAKNQTRDATLEIDLTDLGIDPSHAYARTLWTEDASPASAELDARRGELKVADLPGHRLILVGLDAAPPSETAAAAEALPDWVDADPPPAVVDLGFTDPQTQRFAPGEAPHVTADDDELEVGMWRLPDRVLLLVRNTAEQGQKNVELRVDLDALDLTPERKWQEFIAVRQIWAEDGAREPRLKFYQRTLEMQKLPAGAGRLVVIRRY